jgi:hypothetical protein
MAASGESCRRRRHPWSSLTDPERLRAQRFAIICCTKNGREPWPCMNLACVRWETAALITSMCFEFEQAIFSTGADGEPRTRHDPSLATESAELLAFTFLSSVRKTGVHPRKGRQCNQLIRKSHEPSVLRHSGV